MQVRFGPFASPLSAARFAAIILPAGLLLGALGFEHLGGYAPCEMCLWQRWPHLVAVVLALGAIATRVSPAKSLTLTALAAVAIAASGLIGAFHAGVEYGWWDGLTTCSTSTMAGDPMDAIMNAPLTRCDVAPWTLFGISIAGYNAALSVAGALLIGLLLLWRREARP